MTIKHTAGDVDLESVISELARKRVSVGIFEDSTYPDGTPVAYIAAIQEYGHQAGNIPPRPFMRPAMRDNADKHESAIAAAFRRAVAGRQTVTQGLDQLGQTAAGDVQAAIIAVTSPALAESTLRGRASRHHAGGASSKPLVDTGQMLQSITYRVEDK